MDPIEIPANTNAADKASILNDELTTQGVRLQVYVKGTNKVESLGTLSVKSDTTNESVKLSSLLPNGGTGQIGFGGTVSSSTVTGSPSVFSAALGYDETGALATASVGFDQLSPGNQNINGVLTSLYTQFQSELSSDQQDNLHLDLTTDAITYDFAAGPLTAFVQNFTSSPTTTQVLALNEVPEPGTLATLAFGLGVLALAGACRKITRNSPKSPRRWSPSP